MDGYQASARDKERAVDIGVISRSLERYYRTQAVAIGATYPPSTVDSSDFSSIVDRLDAVISPTQDENSITIASSGNNQTPTIDEYTYQPLNLDGSLCTDAPCVRYKLFYKLEVSNTVVVKNSMRQQ